MFNAHFSFADNRKILKVLNALTDIGQNDIVDMFDKSDIMCNRLLEIYDYAKEENIDLQDACIFAMWG